MGWGMCRFFRGPWHELAYSFPMVKENSLNVQENQAFWLTCKGIFARHPDHLCGLWLVGGQKPLPELRFPVTFDVASSVDGDISWRWARVWET